jgi:hypothetical protein
MSARAACRVGVTLVLAAASGCSGRYEGASAESKDVPRLDTFGAVVQNIDYACGNLECHGTTARNLKLYGIYGLRLDSADVACGRSTTTEELDVDYRSAVGLEPELMAEVVASGGADPQRLTLIRKAAGTEAHAGGSVYPVGSDGYVCMTNWLTGSTDVSACNNAFQSGTPYVKCK